MLFVKNSFINPEKRISLLLFIGNYDVGSVVDKKADFAISPFAFRQQRAEAIDYLVIWAGATFGRFYIKSPRETYDWKVFFQPLYREAWIGIAAFCLVIPVLIATITSYRKNTYYK